MASPTTWCETDNGMMVRHGTIGLLALLTAASAAAEPSRMFIQEVSHVATTGTVYIDLFNSTGARTRRGESQLRLGMRGGEFIASTENLGFKAMVRQNVATYFKLGLDSSSALNATVGGTFTLANAAMLVNLNPEFIKTSQNNRADLNGALFLPLRTPRRWGRILIGGEVSLSDTANKPGLATGLRWVPISRLTLDIILAGDGGTTQGALATPAALRANLRL